MAICLISRSFPRGMGAMATAPNRGRNIRGERGEVELSHFPSQYWRPSRAGWQVASICRAFSSQGRASSH